MVVIVSFLLQFKSVLGKDESFNHLCFLTEPNLGKIQLVITNSSSISVYRERELNVAKA